jgi:septum formation inhibitor MinC
MPKPICNIFCFEIAQMLDKTIYKISKQYKKKYKDLRVFPRGNTLSKNKKLEKYIITKKNYRILKKRITKNQKMDIFISAKILQFIMEKK